MKFYYHRPCVDNSSLLLFFAGWGVDQHPFLPLLPKDRNLLLLFSYADQNEQEVVDICREYEDIQLLAWSMGVWAGAEFLHRQPAIAGKCSFAVAINGTLLPIDGQYGIEPTIFAEMEKNCSHEVVTTFQKKMCRKEFSRYQESAPLRDLADLQSELSYFLATSREGTQTNFYYDFAVIGRADFIIPAKNQQRFWQDSSVVLLALPHFPFYHWSDLAACLAHCMELRDA